MLGNVLVVLVSLAVGWTALLPVRRTVGPYAYHVAAMPIGLIGWAWVSAWTGVLRVPYGWPVVGGGLATYAVLVAGILAWRARPGEVDFDGKWPRFPEWTYLVALGFVAGTALLSVWSRASAFSADSWADYELIGMRLHDTGSLTYWMVAIRNALLPSVHAGARMMGADWTYVVYPVLAAHVAVLVLGEVYVRAVVRIGRGWGGALALLVTGLMVTTAPFLFHTLYVHSHMVSALYLTLAVVGIGRAYVPPGVGFRVRGTDVPAWRNSWLAVTGLAVAGLVLARPDGLAYAVVPLALFAARWFAAGMRRAEVTTLFPAALTVPATVFGITLARYGLWVQQDKLHGAHAVVLLACYIALAVLLAASVRWKLGAAWLAQDDHATRVTLVLAAFGFGLASRSVPVDFGMAMANIAQNLFHTGGYNSLWSFALGLAVLAGVFPQLRREPVVRQLLVAIALFFITAATVHGLTHVGRANWGDSFSRVSFHVVPLVFLLLGHSASTLLAGSRIARRRHSTIEIASTGHKSTQSRTGP